MFPPPSITPRPAWMPRSRFRIARLRVSFVIADLSNEIPVVLRLARFFLIRLWRESEAKIPVSPFRENELLRIRT